MRKLPILYDVKFAKWPMKLITNLPSKHYHGWLETTAGLSGSAGSHSRGDPVEGAEALGENDHTRE
jgi:hypothetical protein